MSDDEILSGYELARNWVDQRGHDLARVQSAEGITIGSSWVWCNVYMDFDYIQAWLLEVSSDGPLIDLYGQQHPSQVADHLAVIWYPVADGTGFHAGRKFDVQWRNKPYERWPGNAESRIVSREGWVWFAGLVGDWFEEQDQ